MPEDIDDFRLPIADLLQPSALQKIGNWKSEIGDHL
jgi:hypothetical protein